MHRLRKSFEAKTGPFAGPVEADETFVGGKRCSMSNAECRELKDAGRGAVGKAAVVRVKDRATNEVRVRHVESADALDVSGFVAERAKFGSKVYTDEASAYHILEQWHDHETVKHSVSEYVRGQAHTNGIESFWSMLKRGYVETYH